MDRADHTKDHMELTTWVDAPDGSKIRKSYVIVAKNYLSDVELGPLNHIVSSYLNFAETMTLR